MLLVYLKRRCYPLFSSKFLIGQLYSNWPGSSSRTVNEQQQMQLNSDVRQFIVHIHVHVQASVVNGK